MVWAKKRAVPDISVTHIWDPVAGIFMWGLYKASDSLSVTGNLVQGSEGIGAAFAAVDCLNSSTFAFRDNTFGSSDMVGVLVNAVGQNICHWAGDFAVYHAIKGVIVAAQAVIDKGYIVENLRVAETTGSIILRHGSLNSRFNTGWALTNFVSALLRTDCPECFNYDNRSCINSWGIQLSLSSLTASKFPFFKDPIGSYDVLCVPTSTYQTAYFRGNTFHNFLKTYPAGFEVCSQDNKNFVFKNHGSASDATASHYLHNNTCSPCDEDSKILIENPKP
jgi:hypothetical protein